MPNECVLRGPNKTQQLIVQADRTNVFVGQAVKVRVSTPSPWGGVQILSFRFGAEQQRRSSLVAVELTLWAALEAWDFRWGAGSVPTTLAVFWAEELGRRVWMDAETEAMPVYEFMARRTRPAQRLEALGAALDSLDASFGTWKTPWGDINRFQRLNGDIVQPFNDSAPSLAVPFPSAVWGSLASFGAREYPGTKKRYGTSGNSFVAGVEFGERVRAKAVTAGGLNSVPSSKHFNDQAERYATGNLRDVYFYREELKGHTEREYHPGEK
jgi:acyl-homoserine-lactone acylase